MVCAAEAAAWVTHKGRSVMSEHDALHMAEPHALAGRMGPEHAASKYNGARHVSSGPTFKVAGRSKHEAHQAAGAASQSYNTLTPVTPVIPVLSVYRRLAPLRHVGRRPVSSSCL